MFWLNLLLTHVLLFTMLAFTMLIVRLIGYLALRRDAKLTPGWSKTLESTSLEDLQQIFWQT